MCYNIGATSSEGEIGGKRRMKFLYLKASFNWFINSYMVYMFRRDLSANCELGGNTKVLVFCSIFYIIFSIVFTFFLIICSIFLTFFILFLWYLISFLYNSFSTITRVFPIYYLPIVNMCRSTPLQTYKKSTPDPLQPIKP